MVRLVPRAQRVRKGRKDPPEPQDAPEPRDQPESQAPPESQVQPEPQDQPAPQGLKEAALMASRNLGQVASSRFRLALPRSQLNCTAPVVVGVQK